MSDELKELSEIKDQLKSLNQKFDILIYGLVSSGKLNNVAVSNPFRNSNGSAYFGVESENQG